MEGSKTKYCYIYCRVSTDKQEFSNDNQSRACNEYAKTNGYEVLDIFIDDGASGRTTDRPKFQEMLKAIEEHPVDACVTYKIDRFARNVGNFNDIRKNFKKIGVRLLSVNEGGDVTEGLIGNIFASVAEWESDVIGQRTRDGLDQKFRTGWWPGWAPLGYINIRKEDNKDIGIVVPDPTKAELIKLAFKLYATGNYSLLKLIRILHKKGLRTRTGQPLAHSTIQQIFNNPFYYGVMRWKGQEKRGNHEPLVSEKLFRLCSLVAIKHANYVIRERKHDFLLRSFIFCSKCGQRMTAEFHYDDIKLKKRGGKIAYYHCMKRNPCDSKYCNAENLEKEIARYFKRIKFSKAFTDAVTRQVRRYLKNKDKEQAKIRKGYTNQRSSLTQKRAILEKRLLDETIDRNTFKRLHEQIQTDINNIDNEAARLESSRNFDFDLLEEVLAFTRNVPKAYLSAPKFLKKNYLRFFFNKLYINEEKVVNTEFSPLVQELINEQELILSLAWLPGLDSDQRPYSYRNPLVTKRPGLSHRPLGMSGI